MHALPVHIKRKWIWWIFPCCLCNLLVTGTNGYKPKIGWRKVRFKTRASRFDSETLSKSSGDVFKSAIQFENFRAYLCCCILLMRCAPCYSSKYGHYIMCSTIVEWSNGLKDSGQMWNLRTFNNDKLCFYSCFYKQVKKPVGSWRPSSADSSLGVSFGGLSEINP